MSDSLLRLYHALPQRFRSVAASLYGYRLRHTRYGGSSARHMAEAVERETWTPAQWKNWREERLAQVLHRAATRVPFYRDHWQQRRRRGDKSSWEILENWPLLEKESLRTSPHAFVADDCDTRTMFKASTSGTTFKPLSVWWSKETARQWCALREVRCQGWYGKTRHDRWAHIGARWVTPVDQREPPFWVWNRAFQQLYMSAYHLAPDLVPYYLDAIREYRISYLWGYPSALYSLAKGVLRMGLRDVKMDVVITDAEQLFDFQRQTISEAFQCSVCETYGMGEIVAGASQCPHGTLHLWPEAGWIEVMEDGLPTQPGLVGELVCTGLMNADMPLIRYRIGDRGKLKTNEPCGCGRTLPALAGLDGRADDVLYTLDGRAVGRLCTVIADNIAVYEAQLIQEKLDRVRVKYVPTPDFTTSDYQAITDRLSACMGDVDVLFERVDRVQRGPNGKFRTVLCELSADQLKAVRAGAMPVGQLGTV